TLISYFLYRYMRPKDIYVHADIQGASSVIIRNTTGEEIPPKTLLEAGTMAISYSVAWDAKVVTNSYWVYSHQVSKTAPTGEYLGTGSFMIRGKKNFLPSCHLIMGLSLLFKLEDSFLQRHAGERKIRTTEDKINGDKIEQPEISSTDLNEINEACESINEYGKNSFPNTEVKIEHDTGRITVKTDLLDETNKTDAVDQQSLDIINDEDTVIIKPAPSRKKNQSTKKRREDKERSEKANIEMVYVASPETDKSSSKVKRGQKGKLKKIKLKYRDQDDEERKIRMMILNSSGKDKPIDNNERQEEKPTSLKKITAASENILTKNQVEIEDIDDSPITVDTDLLDSLTGVPFDDDELLFAIPVVAPYQALQQYK
ncbi:PREDICTED: nuclear export mediator factor NEMF homolog, partial [Drosophila arizonae]|uniref:Nuclear export mediator factor NEMF homolog n=1 Tax=Drosophila arizonae TaxID=7263 RepID=A0ABM1Q0J3_DROAR